MRLEIFIYIVLVIIFTISACVNLCALIDNNEKD